MGLWLKREEGGRGEGEDYFPSSSHTEILYNVPKINLFPQSHLAHLAK